MEVCQVNEKNFAKFGKFISADQNKSREHFDGFFYTGNIAVCELFPATSISLLEPEKRDISLKSMEAHKETEEVCIAIKNDCLFFVAEDVNGSPDVNNIHAFILREGDTVIYAKGVWHWVPFCINSEYCKQLIVYKNNTGANDFYQYDLSEAIKVSL